MPEETNTRNKKLQIRYYEHELEEIKKMAKNLKINTADLGRTAIKEYMERQLNPLLANQTNGNINRNALKNEEIEKKMGYLIKQMKKLTLVISQKTQLQMKFPSDIDADENLEQNIEKISEVIREHQKTKAYKDVKASITMEEILERTKLEEDIVFDILINTDKFKSLKRGWDLNEQS